MGFMFPGVVWWAFRLFSRLEFVSRVWTLFFVFTTYCRLGIRGLGLGIGCVDVGVTLVNCKGVKGAVRRVTLKEKRRVISVMSVGGPRRVRSSGFGDTSITVRFAAPTATFGGCVRYFTTNVPIISNAAK